MREEVWDWALGIIYKGNVEMGENIEMDEKKILLSMAYPILREAGGEY